MVDDRLVSCFIPKFGSISDWGQLDLVVDPFGWYTLEFYFDMMDDAHDEEEKGEEEDPHLDEFDQWCIERPIIKSCLGFDFDQGHVGLVERNNLFGQHRQLDLIGFDFDMEISRERDHDVALDQEK